MNTSVISDINGKDIESSMKQSTLSMLRVLARTVSQMTINLVLNVQTRRTPMELYSSRFAGKIEAQ